MNDIINNREKNLLQVEGIVDRVVYYNEVNGYTVCELLIGEAEFYTLVGSMPYIIEGETIRALGKWEVHPSFGKQFKVECFEKQLPSTVKTILKYLYSRAVKGIGPVTAKRIVEKYGENTFDVIENHPEWLSELPGISEKKALEIGENFRTQFGIRTVMMFCRDFFGPITSVRIYKKWGTAAIDIIKENPYVLCDEIYGVGFEKADSIAKSFSIPKNNKNRVKSGIKYILTYNGNQNGHCYIPLDMLIPAASKLLGVEHNEVEEAIELLETTREVFIVDIDERQCVYLKRYYDAEKYIASKLDLLDKFCPKLSSDDINSFIMKIEREENISYAADQRKAIAAAINNGVTILTGGPGTGKTTVIRAVIRVFEQMGYEFVLAAPTGRAAKRMSEATKTEAKTIHRMLEMDFSDERNPEFKRNENSLLDEEVIIIDEASMIDTLLMESLLKAIKPGGRLILIGDADQLPSIGAGNILNDLIESSFFATIKLTEIFRQAQESLIITNAHSINSGEYPNLTTNNKDFFFISRNNDKDITDTICDLCKNRLPKKYGDSIVDSIQVITPSHKGAAGTEILNARLQEVLNPHEVFKKQKQVRDIVFREGDKVMQIRNNYNIEWKKNDNEGIGVFNGDIGVIEKIDLTEECMTINFDDRIVNYDFTMLDELEHAYAITIHKSQGSEYPIVIIPAYSYSPRLLTRNLLYTAVTRAQQMVIIVGKKDVIAGMVDNNRHTKRFTGLVYILSCYEDL